MDKGEPKQTSRSKNIEESKKRGERAKMVMQEPEWTSESQIEQAKA